MSFPCFEIVITVVCLHISGNLPSVHNLLFFLKSSFNDFELVMDFIRSYSDIRSFYSLLMKTGYCIVPGFLI